nr:TNF receptor-associated factor 5-like [Dermacentor andersoni]
MHDQGTSVVHVLSGHAVTGVNWRPTWFAEDVPHSRICGLCHTVPERTVLLPCSHFLCGACSAARDQDGRCVCPLDMKTFEEDECSWIDFPARRAINLKAHCWNRADGCDFVGTITAALQHYETECAHHGLKCPRCERRVLHRDLGAHYVAGCARSDPSASGAQPNLQKSSLTSRGVSATLEEITSLRGLCHDQLSALQIKVNGLLELSKTSDAARNPDISRVVRDLENSLACKL